MGNGGFLDEKILKMIDEAEKPEAAPGPGRDAETETPPSRQGAKTEAPREERTIYTGLRIAGQWTEFEERRFLGGLVAMTVPAEFKEMSQEMAKIKYPMERRPETILTDHTGTVNILVSDLGEPMKNEDAATIRDGMLKIMRRVNPGIRPLATGVEAASDRDLAYVEFSNNAIDGKVYNLMFFLEAAGKATMISFNCLTKTMKYWKKPAYEMMRSVKVGTKEGGEQGSLTVDS